MPYAAIRVLAFLLLVPTFVAVAAGPPESAPATSQPAAVQPGVWIDWSQRAVIVQAHVVLRSGPLEFLACFGGKEHESIVRFDAQATSIYMALGLIGVTPGQPPTWDPATDEVRPATGELVDIAFTWDDAGTARTADAFDWLRELEYGRPPLARPWIFCGSLRTPDAALSADISGVGVAVVDFPDSLIAYSRDFSSRNDELWVGANSAVIPPVGTTVRVILRPARPRTVRIALDGCGVARVDGRFACWADVADIVGLNRRLDPERVQTITVASGALRADVAAFERALRAAGLAAGAYVLEPAKAEGAARASDGRRRASDGGA